MQRYIGAYGVLVRDGAVLLIRKARGPNTGTLDLPGGGLECGESGFMLTKPLGTTMDGCGRIGVGSDFNGERP